MPSGSRVALIALLALSAVAAVPQASAVGSQQIDAEPTTQAASTTITVNLSASGDARWTVSTTFDLASQNETAAYRDLADAFERGETASLGLDAFRRSSDLASAATGRQMAITDVNRRSASNETVGNGTGRLTLSFTWTNFARVDEDRLAVGDAFETAGGTWFSGIDADQVFVVQPPDGYGVVNANVAPENGTLRWVGPQAFTPETLSATFTGATTDPITASPTPDQPAEGTPWLGLIVLGVGVLATAGYLLARRRDEIGTPTPSEEPTGDTDEAAGDGADATGDGETEPSDDAVDTELLSDEERVERLLEENGGRMKQARIVTETGWSNAKVSQLLSSMADDGRIDKLRIGRENLISFPDEELTDVDDEE